MTLITSLTTLNRPLDPRLLPVIEARSHDPQSLLGWHRHGHTWRLRVFDPQADRVELETERGWEELERVNGTALFELERAAPARPVRLRTMSYGQAYERIDPYSFQTSISDEDLWHFNAGSARQAYQALGAHPVTLDGVAGVRFGVWAPNAERVSVVGDFNRWDGRLHMMQSRGGSGVWEMFIPGLAPGDLYKFEIRNRHTGAVLVKADPYARDAERRPGTASRVAAASTHTWRDGEWLAQRASWDWLHAPMSAYEVHTGSWRRHPDGREYTYEELAESLVPYVVEMGYTHIELMPITKHPLDESWGYQTTGYFAPTRRHGAPDGLRALIDACHVAGIGVILDWVPGHFPRDGWALAHFDGTALYEHEDPRLGVHPDWGTATFNYGRNEVRSFLLSSAHYWLSDFHFDALRVDAVASMLYLDYSRREGEWVPNKYGGRENLEAIDFLRLLNEMVHADFPGALTIAEESTAWPMVSRPTYLGGLGFSLKWNMGWMHDTLKYMSREPIYRRYHHDQLTFGQLYAYSENFVLPFSHDEVVHGKGSLVGKMPGDDWQRHANARLLAFYQMTYPGKKINFMGNELAETREWSEKIEIGWWLLQFAPHAGHQRLARDLNRLYVQRPALHELDHTWDGFSWLDCHDADKSVISYLRRARDGSFVVVVLNFTPVPREDYRVAVPKLGWYRELLNSDSQFYGGSGIGNDGGVMAEDVGHVDYPHSIVVTLPPLAGLVFALD